MTKEPTRTAETQAPGALAVAFGLNLRAHREAQGLTQLQFGDLIRCHYNYLGAIERAERNITLKIVEDLCRKIGRDPLEMLSMPDDEGTAPETVSPHS